MCLILLADKWWKRLDFYDWLIYTCQADYWFGLMGDRLMVGRRALDAVIMVRIHVSQPILWGWLTDW